MRFGFILISLLFANSAFAKRIPRQKKNEIAEHFCGNEQTCNRMVKRHLIRDIRGCQLDPAWVDKTPEVMFQNNLESKKIRGLNLYMGFFPGKYSYTVSMTDNGGIKIKGDVYFTNHKKWDQATEAWNLRMMQEKLDRAAEMWEANNPFGFPLDFEFNVVKKRWPSDVKTRLVERSSRGPYFSNWSMRWGYRTIAHEMGHVMGLDDEYKNGLPSGDPSRCDRGTMMCTTGPAHPYHYYMIMRRVLCRAKI